MKGRGAASERRAEAQQIDRADLLKRTRYFKKRGHKKGRMLGDSNCASWPNDIRGLKLVRGSKIFSGRGRKKRVGTKGGRVQTNKKATVKKTALGKGKNLKQPNKTMSQKKRKRLEPRSGNLRGNTGANFEENAFWSLYLGGGRP